MLKVYIAQNPTEAHLVRGLLETQNIECFVKGETLFSARGELPITSETAPSVWIYDKARLVDAEGIVQDYERALGNEEQPAAIWECHSCGEMLEGQFTQCWKCGKEK